MPFLPAGSGQDAALAVLEDRFQPNMTVSDISPLHTLRVHWWEVYTRELGKRRGTLAYSRARLLGGDD